MRNPLRSEAEAFRFLIVVIVGALVVVGAAALNVWLGVVAAVVVVGGVGWWLMKGDLRTKPATVLTSSSPPGVHRVLVLAAPGTTEVQVDPRATDVVVVVPALATPVEAITGAVDDRRAEAAETASLLAAQLPNARPEIGADDPLLAIADSLRAFGADEIVIAGGDDELVEQARERFALPVTRG
jgi:hypothetical protein